MRDMPTYLPPYMKTFKLANQQLKTTKIDVHLSFTNAFSDWLSAELPVRTSGVD